MIEKKPAKAKKAPVKKFELAKIDVRQLPELQGWKTKLQKIDKENPVLEVTDKLSYEAAKKNRMARRQGRYEVQAQDKELAKIFKELRSQTQTVAGELIEIILPGENAQDEKIKAWEAAEEIRLEAKRIAEENRKQAIKDRINEIYLEFITSLRNTTFEKIDILQADFENLGVLDREEFEEFEADYLEAVDKLEDLKDEKINDLNQREAERKEAEAARLEAVEANRKAKEQAAIAKEEFRVAQAAAKEKEASQEKELKQLREMKAKAEAEKMDFRKNSLLNYGFKEEATGSPMQLWNAVKEEIVLIEDLLKLSEVGFNDFVMDQKIAIKQAAIMESEKEEANKKQAAFDEAAKIGNEITAEIENLKEVKLLNVDFSEVEHEEVKPENITPKLSQDATRLMIYISGIDFTQPPGFLKSRAANLYMEEISEKVADLRLELIKGIEKI